MLYGQFYGQLCSLHRNMVLRFYKERVENKSAFHEDLGYLLN